MCYVCPDCPARLVWPARHVYSVSCHVCFVCVVAFCMLVGVFDLLVCCVWFVRVACSVCLVCGVFVWFVCMSGWYVLPVLVC